jgi:hypothetical protein
MAKYSNQLIWRHNSCFGHAAMMKAQCREIMRSPTATPESMRIAGEIRRLAYQLSESLKTRKEPT